MRITAIQTFPVRVPLVPSHRMVSNLGRHDVSDYLLVRVETDGGLIGAGEATVLPRWSGETAVGAREMIEQVFAPRLLGHDPGDIDGLDAVMDRLAIGNWFAKSAVEMACWDLAGKAAGKPVYELLGGPVRSRQVRCRFSMGAYPPERATARAAELVAAGFTTIKVKVGTGLDEDVQRVRAVREAAGDAVELVIDANGGYSVSEAVEAAARLTDCRIALFEQPTPRGDFCGLADVRRRAALPVMADDICFDLADAEECLRHEACDVISVYPGKNGGIAKAKRIAELAGRHGVACTIGSNLELDVGTAAMLHLVVGCRNVQVERYPGDALGPSYHAHAIVHEPLPITGPFVELSDRPGLGMEVDWDAVERLRP